MQYSDIVFIFAEKHTVLGIHWNYLAEVITVTIHKINTLVHKITKFY